MLEIANRRFVHCVSARSLCRLCCRHGAQGCLGQPGAFPGMETDNEKLSDSPTGRGTRVFAVQVWEMGKLFANTVGGLPPLLAKQAPKLCLPRLDRSKGRSFFLFDPI